MSEEIKEIWWRLTAKGTPAREVNELAEKLNEVIRVVNRLAGQGEEPA